MKRVRTAVTAAIAILLIAAAQNTPSTNANELTIDGERFHKAHITFAPKDCGAVWFTDTVNAGKASSTRMTMHGTLDQRNIELQLSFPTNKIGEITITPGDDDNWNLSHWAILVQSDGPTYGSGLHAKLDSITIKLTRYDAPGGMIEGTFAGSLQQGIRVEGSFSIKRGKDISSF
jgi:hypothetical protein